MPKVYHSCELWQRTEGGGKSLLNKGSFSEEEEAFLVHTINGVCLVQAQNQQRRIVITMVRNRNTAAKTTESFIFWSIEWIGKWIYYVFGPFGNPAFGL